MAVVTYIFLILSLFLIFYSIALYKRKVPTIHKRRMLFASISVLQPALFRGNRIFDLNFPLDVLQHLPLMIMMIIYDIRTLEKVHLPNLVGTLAIIMGFAGSITLINTDSWNETIKSFTGWKLKKINFLSQNINEMDMEKVVKTMFLDIWRQKNACNLKSKYH